MKGQKKATGAGQKKAEPSPKKGDSVETISSPDGAAPGTVLLKLTVSVGSMKNLNACARAALRVPLAWVKRKSGVRPVRLQWHGEHTRHAWVVAGTDHATEVLAALAAGCVAPRIDALRHQLRRVPAGAILTDPSGAGDRKAVELAGLPLLVRVRRGYWPPYSVLSGAAWPATASRVLGDFIAGTVGYEPPPRAALEVKRYVVEERWAASVGPAQWRESSRWGALDEAVAEMRRVALADLRADRPAIRRVLDAGTGAVMAATRGVRGKRGPAELRVVVHAPGPRSATGAVSMLALEAP